MIAKDLKFLIVLLGLNTTRSGLITSALERREILSVQTQMVFTIDLSFLILESKIIGVFIPIRQAATNLLCCAGCATIEQLIMIHIHARLRVIDIVIWPGRGHLKAWSTLA